MSASRTTKVAGSSPLAMFSRIVPNSIQLAGSDNQRADKRAHYRLRRRQGSKGQKEKAGEDFSFPAFGRIRWFQVLLNLTRRLLLRRTLNFTL